MSCRARRWPVSIRSAITSGTAASRRLNRSALDGRSANGAAVTWLPSGGRSPGGACAPARWASATTRAAAIASTRHPPGRYNRAMADAPAFIDAIKAGEFDRVKAMLSADPALIESRAKNGESAILTAVYHGQKEIVNLLVSRGAAMTIFEASAAGEVERVERLLEQSSPANGYSPDGWTPLHLAAFFGHARIAEMLLAHEADVAALAGNHKFVAGLLIGQGADVNAPDAAGWRPLHLAAANNILDALKALIAQGADVNAANNDGQTPLSLAQEKNHREAAALLRRHGA
ncbi:MAG: hypothetical protein DMG03_16380 [Acidobacteria bacterium]|nr:MAG: hypothetical protein DMG03_16380 [Acidobacteriota bacterium]